jgi:hypothetical protein
LTIIWKFQQSQARALAAAMGREPMQAGMAGVERKPLWVRVAGGTTTVLLWLSWLFLFSTVKSPPQSDLRDAGSILGLAGLPGAALWAIATLAWKARKTISLSNAGPSAQTARATATPVTESSAASHQYLTNAPELASASQASTESSAGVYTYSAPGMAMCPECGRNPTIFYCSSHHHGLCLDCVAKHDNPRECVYVPAFRGRCPDFRWRLSDGSPARFG